MEQGVLSSGRPAGGAPVGGLGRGSPRDRSGLSKGQGSAASRARGQGPTGPSWVVAEAGERRGAAGGALSSAELDRQEERAT